MALLHEALEVPMTSERLWLEPVCVRLKEKGLRLVTEVSKDDKLEAQRAAVAVIQNDPFLMLWLIHRSEVLEAIGEVTDEWRVDVIDRLEPDADQTDCDDLETWHGNLYSFSPLSIIAPQARDVEHVDLADCPVTLQLADGTRLDIDGVVATMTVRYVEPAQLCDGDLGEQVTFSLGMAEVPEGWRGSYRVIVLRMLRAHDGRWWVVREELGSSDIVAAKLSDLCSLEVVRW